MAICFHLSVALPVTLCVFVYRQSSKPQKCKLIGCDAQEDAATVTRIRWSLATTFLVWSSQDGLENISLYLHHIHKINSHGNHDCWWLLLIKNKRILKLSIFLELAGTVYAHSNDRSSILTNLPSCSLLLICHCSHAKIYPWRGASESCDFNTNYFMHTLHFTLALHPYNGVISININTQT